MTHSLGVAVLALLALLVDARLASAGAAEPPVRAVAVLLTPAETHANAILQGLTTVLAPAGYRIVRPQLPPTGKANAWRGTTDVLVRLLYQDGIRVFVVGAERNLCHLALQFAVKGGARSILIGCPDADARTLPIRDGHTVNVPDGGRTEESWKRAAVEAGRLVLELERNPPTSKTSPFKRR